MKLKRAVFLDRDGTLNHDVGYTHKIEDLRLLDGVVEGLQLISEMGFSLIVTTNQAGIARGYFTEQQMHDFNRHLLEIFRFYSIIIDGIYFCPYHATAGIGSYKRESNWRKPQPGMILQAAKDRQIDLSRSYAIGDKKSDILAGQAAGCTSILVLTGLAGTDQVEATALPDYVASDLLEAAKIIKDTESIKLCS
jgi:D-glycero-D-manno-heptose 1,7-bisphosphate phosphatase